MAQQPHAHSGEQRPLDGSSRPFPDHQDHKEQVSNRAEREAAHAD